MRALIAILLAWSVFVSMSRADERKFNDIPDYAEKSIEALAGVLNSDERSVTDFLAQRGFPPQESWRRFLGLSALNDSFDQWPSIRKIEAAYHMAEEAAPGTGEQLLRDLAVEIAVTRNVAIIDERSLSRYFPNGRPRSTNPVRVYKFKHMTKSGMSSAMSNLRPDMQATIEIVSKYAHALPGGTVSALAHCCNISESSAFRILREAPSNRYAIYRGLKMGTLPPELLDRLDRLIELVKSHNIAISPELEKIYELRQTTKLTERVHELVQSEKSDSEVAEDPKIKELLAAGVAATALSTAIAKARRPACRPRMGLTPKGAGERGIRAAPGPGQTMVSVPGENLVTVRNPGGARRSVRRRLIVFFDGPDRPMLCSFHDWFSPRTRRPRQAPMLIM